MTYQDAIAALEAAKVTGDVAAIIAAAEALAKTGAAATRARKPRVVKAAATAWWNDAKPAKGRNPAKYSLAVTFADGSRFRVNAWRTSPDKPIAVGRALAVAIEFRRQRVPYTFHLAVPEFASVALVDGESFDPAECSRLTAELRREMPELRTERVRERERAKAAALALQARWEAEIAAVEAEPLEAAYPDSEEEPEPTGPVVVSGSPIAASDEPMCVAHCTSHRGRDRLRAVVGALPLHIIGGERCGSYRIPLRFADALAGVKGVRLTGMPRKPRRTPVEPAPAVVVASEPETPPGAIPAAAIAVPERPRVRVKAGSSPVVVCKPRVRVKAGSRPSAWRLSDFDSPFPAHDLALAEFRRDKVGAGERDGERPGEAIWQVQDFPTGNPRVRRQSKRVDDLAALLVKAKELDWRDVVRRRVNIMRAAHATLYLPRSIPIKRRANPIRRSVYRAASAEYDRLYGGVGVSRVAVSGRAS